MRKVKKYQGGGSNSQYQNRIDYTNIPFPYVENMEDVGGLVDPRYVSKIRGIRNQNPGNLKATPSQIRKGEVAADEKGFRVFDSYESGRRALMNDLAHKLSGKSTAVAGSTYMISKYGSRAKDYKDYWTVEDYINVFAPSGNHGGDNDHEAVKNYITKTSSRLGLSPRTKMKDLNISDVDRLIKAQIKQENKDAYKKLYPSQKQAGQLPTRQDSIDLNNFSNKLMGAVLSDGSYTQITNSLYRDKAIANLKNRPNADVAALIDNTKEFETWTTKNGIKSQVEWYKNKANKNIQPTSYERFLRINGTDIATDFFRVMGVFPDVPGGITIPIFPPPKPIKDPKYNNFVPPPKPMVYKPKAQVEKAQAGFIPKKLQAGFDPYRVYNNEDEDFQFPDNPVDNARYIRAEDIMQGIRYEDGVYETANYVFTPKTGYTPWLKENELTSKGFQSIYPEVTNKARHMHRTRGNPYIQRIGDYVRANYRYDKRGLDGYTNDEKNASMMQVQNRSDQFYSDWIAELAHAEQFTKDRNKYINHFQEDRNKLLNLKADEVKKDPEYKKLIEEGYDERSALRSVFYDKYYEDTRDAVAYKVPGYAEHEAHRIIQPRLEKEIVDFVKAQIWSKHTMPNINKGLPFENPATFNPKELLDKVSERQLLKLKLSNINKLDPANLSENYKNANLNKVKESINDSLAARRTKDLEEIDKFVSRVQFSLDDVMVSGNKDFLKAINQYKDRIDRDGVSKENVFRKNLERIVNSKNVDETKEQSEEFLRMLRDSELGKNMFFLPGIISNQPNKNNIPTKPTSLPPIERAQAGGFINTTGYTPGTATYDNPINIIPSNNITMENTPFPVLAIPNNGEPEVLMPGDKKIFSKASSVTEIPLRSFNKQLRKRWKR